MLIGVIRWNRERSDLQRAAGIRTISRRAR
jgi:hypothetical protein